MNAPTKWAPCHWPSCLDRTYLGIDKFSVDYVILSCKVSQLNKVRNIFFMIDNLIFCERLWFDFDSVSTEIHWDTFIEMWMYLFYLWLGLIHCNYWGHFFQMWPGSHRIEGPGENQSNCVQVHHQLWCSVQGGEWNLTMRWMGK